MSEKISFYCEHCSFHVTAPAKLAGRQGRCPQCQQVMLIPHSDRKQEAPASSPPHVDPFAAKTSSQPLSSSYSPPSPPPPPSPSPYTQQPPKRRRATNRRSSGASSKSLVGLREKTFGEIISEAFGIVFSANILPLLGISVASFLPMIIVAMIALVPSASSGRPPGGGALLLAGITFSFGVCFLMGALVNAMSCIYQGHAVSVKECLQTGLNKAFPIFLALILMYLVIVGFMILGIFLMIPLAFLGQAAVIIGVIGLYILMIRIMLSFSMVFNVIVVESSGALGAIKRSREMTEGSLLRIFGIFLVMGLILGVFGGISVAGAAAVSFELGQIVNIIFSIVNMMVQLMVSTIVYFDLRVRRESFGLQELASIFD